MSEGARAVYHLGCEENLRGVGWCVCTLPSSASLPPSLRAPSKGWGVCPQAALGQCVSPGSPVWVVWVSPGSARRRVYGNRTQTDRPLCWLRFQPVMSSDSVFSATAGPVLAFWRLLGSCPAQGDEGEAAYSGRLARGLRKAIELRVLR